MPHTLALVLRVLVGPPLAWRPPVHHSCDGTLSCVSLRVGPQLSITAVTAYRAGCLLSVSPGAMSCSRLSVFVQCESKSEGPVSLAAAPLQVARPE